MTYKSILRKTVCYLFGHKHWIRFNTDGVYWCNDGAYDSLCKRCDYKWEKTSIGKIVLIKSKSEDPRII